MAKGQQRSNSRSEEAEKESQREVQGGGAKHFRSAPQEQLESVVAKAIAWTQTGDQTRPSLEPTLRE